MDAVVRVANAPDALTFKACRVTGRPFFSLHPHR